MMTSPPSKKELQPLMQLPGVGISIARDLWDIGIRCPNDIVGRDPQQLYDDSNRQKQCIQDRCLLYVFRCAVYAASYPEPEPAKLKWWNWKDPR